MPLSLREQVKVILDRGTKVTIGQVAEELGMTLRTFQRHFELETKMTFIEFKQQNKGNPKEKMPKDATGKKKSTPKTPVTLPTTTATKEGWLITEQYVDNYLYAIAQACPPSPAIAGQMLSLLEKRNAILPAEKETKDLLQSSEVKKRVNDMFAANPPLSEPIPSQTDP